MDTLRYIYLTVHIYIKIYRDMMPQSSILGLSIYILSSKLCGSLSDCQRTAVWASRMYLCQEVHPSEVVAEGPFDGIR